MLNARPDQRGTKAHSATALAALFGGATCIAASPIWVRVSEVGPIASAFWRVALAVPLLWALLPLGPRTVRSPRTSKLLLAAGVAFAGDLAFWHWSLKLTSVANSALLANLASVLVTLALWRLRGQRPSAEFLAGLVFALGGVALLLRSSAGSSSSGLAGDVLGIITAVFYAWYLISVKDLRDAGMATLRLMAISSSLTALVLFPVTLASGEALFPATLLGWLKLVGLAWISHSAGQGLIAYALAHLPAAFSAVGLLLQPVMSAVLAWVLLGEPLAPLQFAGALVVLAGIYLAHKGAR